MNAPTPATNRPEPVIVVGFDGTPAAIAALDVALAEAVLRHSAVEVVTAWSWSSPYDTAGAAESMEAARDHAQEMQDQAVDRALARMHRTPPVSRTLVHGYPTDVLLAASARAAYLVVGNGRKGALSRAILGSVSEHCVRHATVPVLVVPGPVPQGHQHEELVRAGADG